jgi:hypothetical protein
MFETAVGVTTAELQGLVTASEKSDIPVNVVIAIPFRVAETN